MPKIFKAPYFTQDEIELMPNNDGRLRRPYSDDYLVYDGTKRQYVPTEKLMIENNIDFESINPGDPNGRNGELMKVSDQIYGYNDKKSGSNIETLKCIIAHHYRLGITPFRFREMLKDIFIRQARFYAENGDITDTMTVDVANKQWVDRAIMTEDRQIDPKVKLLLMDLGLCWVGSYDDQFRALVFREDW